MEALTKQSEELVEQAKGLGIEVNPEWTDKGLRRAITMASKEAEQTPEPIKEEKMFPVRLLNHYRPLGQYKVVGEAPEAPYPGVGQNDKLWATTVVALPIDEARKLLENSYQEYETFLADDGTNKKRKITVRRPLAERADEITI